VRDSLIAFMAAARAPGRGDQGRPAGRYSHAKANDATAYRGRKPSFSRQQFDQVQLFLAAGTMNGSEIARHVGLRGMVVARIKTDPAAAEAMLANWGL
jgi:putative DNA-invertase from lambdoid prophage Rac